MITKSDLFRISLRQVVRQKSYGVMFSIALGILAYINLSVLGQEIRYKIGQDMLLMGGVNIIQAHMNDTQYDGQPQREFSQKTIDAIRKLPGIYTVGANSAATFFTLRIGERSFRTQFIAIDQYFWPTYEATLYAGREINATDVKERKRVCNLGIDLAIKLYGSAENSIGQRLFLKSDIFEIVGVVGGVMFGRWAEGGFMPYTTAIDRNWSGKEISRLFIRTISWEDIAALKIAIPKLIKKLQNAPYLEIETREAQLERVTDMFMLVEVLLWLGIVASLILGGFGIWYGTFAAVKIRTREVGLKKAMGGSDADILAQFLTEALCKSIAGGFFGIALAIITVEIGSYLLGGNVSYYNLFLSSFISIVFSALIGIAGGIFPALQASRMDVVTALRYE